MVLSEIERVLVRTVTAKKRRVLAPAIARQVWPERAIVGLGESDRGPVA